MQTTVGSPLDGTLDWAEIFLGKRQKRSCSQRKRPKPGAIPLSEQTDGRRSDEPSSSPRVSRYAKTAVILSKAATRRGIFYAAHAPLSATSQRQGPGVMHTGFHG